MNPENNPSFLSDLIASTLDIIEKGLKKNPIDNENIKKRFLNDIDQLEDLAKEHADKETALTKFNEEIRGKLTSASETGELSLVETPFKSVLTDM